MFVFATAFSPLVGDDQRNFLVIFFAFLSVPLMVYLHLGVGKDVIWLGFVLMGQLLLTLINGQRGELTTVIYTCLLATAYIAVSRGLQTGYVTRDALAKLLKKLILLYGMVSILQMAASLVGLPIPNLILSKGLWSYNSLAVEPSHAARVLSLSMLAYLLLARNKNEIGFRELIGRDKLLVVAFLISTGLTGSAIGIIAALLALLLAMSRARILVAAGLLFLAWPALLSIDFPAIQRSSAFLAALPTMDIPALVEADQSGAMRVMPILLFLDKADPTALEFWFGGGLGAIASYVQGELVGAGELVAAGFIPGYIVAFGVIGTLLFLWAFLFRFVVEATLPIVLLWVILLATSAWNSQIFWYGLMLVRAVHEFQCVQKRKERKSALRFKTLPAATSDEVRAAT